MHSKPEISHYVSRLLQDQQARQSMSQRISELCAEQQKLFDFLQSLPYVSQLFVSVTNFIMLQVPPELCQSLLQHCRNHGLILRNFSQGNSSLAGALRISVGHAGQMTALREALQSFSVAH